MQEMIKKADLNNDGVIDYEEFLAATINKLHLGRNEFALKAFEYFDSDKSGFITKRDLTKALSQIRDSEVSVFLTFWFLQNSLDL